jgi:hypothetical protein
LIEGFHLDKKYPQALGLKLVVYALIAAAVGFTLWEIFNTVFNLLEGQSWEKVLRPENGNK